MKSIRMGIYFLGLLWLVACQDTPPSQPPVATIVPTLPSPAVTNAWDDDIVVQFNLSTTPHQFIDIDSYGNVIGLDIDVLDYLVGDKANYELLTNTGTITDTPDFQQDQSHLKISQFHSSITTTTHTIPYLEIGQQLLVRANESSIVDVDDLSAEKTIAVVKGSYSEHVAQQVLNIDRVYVVPKETISEVAQSVSDSDVDGAIMDHMQAEYYATQYPVRFRIIRNENDVNGWIGHSQKYRMTVSATPSILRTDLDGGIKNLLQGDMDELIQKWLVDTTEIREGNVSLFDPPEDRAMIGVVGELGSLDLYAANKEIIDTEIQHNITARLVQFVARLYR